MPDDDKNSLLPTTHENKSRKEKKAKKEEYSRESSTNFPALLSKLTFCQLTNNSEDINEQ